MLDRRAGCVETRGWRGAGSRRKLGMAHEMLWHGATRDILLGMGLYYSTDGENFDEIYVTVG